MDALKDFDFLLVLFFVVPGFISMRVYELLRPTEPGPLKENIYEAITFSVINYVLMEWAVPLARAYGGAPNGTIPRLLLLAAAFVVVPALLPILLNLGLQWLERRGRILRRAKTAWDDFFCIQIPATYVFRNFGSWAGTGSSSRKLRALKVLCFVLTTIRWSNYSRTARSWI